MPSSPSHTFCQLQHFACIAGRYDALLCDVWGVIHNGLAATPEAADALTRFREAGGTVVLVSNAPRPSARVRDMLARLGVPESAYDAIITSGDVTRTLMAERPGTTVYHLGPDRDAPLFFGLQLGFGPLEAADLVVCTGLFNDEVETPDDYRSMLLGMVERGLLMVCANPDLVVERGRQLVYCAGALAGLYQTMGGQVIFAGKPHAPIYELALGQVASLRNSAVPLSRVLAVGDSVRTDLKGAAGVGIDSLFVIDGIHAEELGTREHPDCGRLQLLLAQARLEPKAVMWRLTW